MRYPLCSHDKVLFIISSGSYFISLIRRCGSWARAWNLYCTMKKGEKALFLLSPLAYEDSGALGVPIGSELHFGVELLSWLTVVDVYKNGGIVKKVLSTEVNRQTGELDEVTGEHSMTNNLAP